MGARSRRIRRAGRRPAHDYRHGGSTVVGWAESEAALPEARQLAHDNLVRLMGDRRTGPVEWRYATGDEARALLATLRHPDEAPEWADNCRRVAAHLREWGGYVVIALAPGRLP